jgi:HlyD family secretion protein
VSGEAAPVDLRSEEVHELLSAEAPYLLRWGISAIALTVVALLGSTWMIRYPDALTGRVVIIPRRPPIPVVARANGRIVRLAVKDGDVVEAGALLALVESPADPADVLALAAELRDVDPAQLGSRAAPRLSLRGPRRLGEVQAAYSAFARDYGELLHLNAQDYAARKAATLQAQIGEQSRANRGLAAQHELAQRKCALVDEQLRAARDLFGQGLVSESELRQSELASLEARSVVQDVEARASTAETQVSDTRARLLDLEQGAAQIAVDRELAARESFKQLQTALATWDDHYALRAPVAGRVSLGQLWADHQFIKANDEVMTVVPEAGPLLGRVALPRGGAGKARAGQRVLIRLADYPYEEFGILEGTVDSLGGVSHEDAYVVNVNLPRGLTTSYGLQIPARPELLGNAEIITDDVRLLLRLLRPLRATAAHLR